MLVLGDSLRRSWNLNLALWSYLRALELGHPNPAQVDARIREIFRHWDEAIGRNKAPWPKTLEDPRETVEAIRRDLKEAAGWVKRFQEVEAELVRAGKPADIPSVEAELARRGISKLRPEAHGVRYSFAGIFSHPWQAGPITRITVTASFGLAVACVVCLAWRSCRRRRGRRLRELS